MQIWCLFVALMPHLATQLFTCYVAYSLTLEQVDGALCICRWCKVTLLMLLYDGHIKNT